MGNSTTRKSISVPDLDIVVKLNETKLGLIIRYNALGDKLPVYIVALTVLECSGADLLGVNHRLRLLTMLNQQPGKCLNEIGNLTLKTSVHRKPLLSELLLICIGSRVILLTERRFERKHANTIPHSLVTTLHESGKFVTDTEDLKEWFNLFCLLTLFKQVSGIVGIVTGYTLEDTAVDRLVFLQLIHEGGTDTITTTGKLGKGASTALILGCEQSCRKHNRELTEKLLVKHLCNTLSVVSLSGPHLDNLSPVSSLIEFRRGVPEVGIYLTIWEDLLKDATDTLNLDIIIREDLVVYRNTLANKIFGTTIAKDVVGKIVDSVLERDNVGVHV